MRVGIRWYQLADWHAENNLLISKPDNICFECPIEWDETIKPDSGMNYRRCDNSWKETTCLYVRQKCTCKPFTCVEMTYWVPLAFIELNHYINRPEG